MNDELDRLKVYLNQRIHACEVLTDEPMPDWYNMHDYSSGFYNGRKIAAQDKIDLLQEILDRLEKI